MAETGQEQGQQLCPHIVLDGLLHLPRDVLDSIYKRLDRIAQISVHQSCRSGRLLARRNATALAYVHSSAAIGVTPCHLLRTFPSAEMLQYSAIELPRSPTLLDLHPKLLHLELNIGHYQPSDFPALASFLRHVPSLQSLTLGSPSWLVYAQDVDASNRPFATTVVDSSSCSGFLAALASLTSLTSLSLVANGVRFNDTFFSDLPALASLRALHLHAWQHADQSKPAALLGRLTTLGLTALTLQGYADLPAALPTSLRSIHLQRQSEPLDRPTFSQLASLPHVQSITISHTPVHLSTLVVSPSPALNHLSLNLPVGPARVELFDLASLTYLRALDLHCHLPCPPDHVLCFLWPLDALTCLHIKDVRATHTMSSRIFRPLASLLSLQSLTLKTDKSPPCDYHDSFPSAANSLQPAISTLHLPWLRINPSHWSAFSTLPALHTLIAASLTLPPSPLPGCPLPPGPSACALLPTLPALRTLTTTDCGPLHVPTSDATLCTLTASARHIHHLSLGNCAAVTDAGLRLLSTSCPSLRHLALFKLSASVTAVGLLPLARLRAVSKLYLQLPRVPPASVALTAAPTAPSTAPVTAALTAAPPAAPIVAPTTPPTAPPIALPTAPPVAPLNAPPTAPLTANSACTSQDSAYVAAGGVPFSTAACSPGPATRAPSSESLDESTALENAAAAIGARVFWEATGCIVVKDALYVPAAAAPADHGKLQQPILVQ